MPPGQKRCTCLVAGPWCGEALRRYLKDNQLLLSGSRPLKEYSPTRTVLPTFPVRGAKDTTGVRDTFLSACRGVVEIIEAGCETREKWEPPASFTVVGDVAIVALSDEIRGREKEVAEELLRNVRGIRAVYGKEVTEGEYRVQRLVHLAGEGIEVTTYREYGLVYRVPLGKVYVNPRLSAEHYRVASRVAPGEIVLDMFAGIGGFSLLISALGKAELVVANDANPWAVSAMLDSIKLNKKKLKTPILVLNMDAKELPRVLRPVFTRIIMNLPHSATKFLDTAHRLCSPRGCIIHVYVVARTREEALSLVPGSISATRVLDYAPRKFIYRVDVAAKGRGDK